MKSTKLALILLVIYIAMTYLVMFTLDPKTIDLITAEDHYFEWIGAISLLVAAALFFYAFFRTHREEKKLGFGPYRKWAYLAFAALFFFGGGEEISWAQRVLGLQTPDAVANFNNKDEINLHNLEMFGSKNSLPFKMYQVFSITYTAIVPLIALRSKRLRDGFERYIHIVPLLFGVAVLANFLLSQIVSRLTYLGQLGEIQESNYEFTFMCIGIYVVYSLLTTIRQSQT
jgi:hypothetical protein